MLLPSLLLGLILPLSYCSCPPGGIYNEQFKKCYTPFNSPLPFSTAEMQCENWGGSLVTIQNAFENSFVGNISQQLTAQSFWIGANFMHDSQWTWTSNATFFYSNWAPGQPSNPMIYQCVSARKSDGKWSTAPCGSSATYICENKMDAAPTTTTQPISTTDTVTPVYPDSNNVLFIMDWSYFGVGQCAQVNTAKCDAQKTYIEEVAQQLYNNSNLNFRAAFGFYGDIDSKNCFNSAIEDYYYSSYNAFVKGLSLLEPSEDCPTTVCDALTGLNSTNPVTRRYLVFISAEGTDSFATCDSQLDSSLYQFVFGVELNGGLGVDLIASSPSGRVAITDAFTQADVDSLVTAITSILLLLG